MIKRRFICSVFAILLGGLFNESVIAQDQKELEPLSVTETFELFNGQDLSGWYPFLKGRQPGEDPNGVFSVQDGMIRVSGEEFGCITTNNAFQNYRIILEFKWGEKTCLGRELKARDSGLLIHSVGKDGAFGGNWKYSIECNIIEGGLGDFIVVGDQSDTFSISANAATEKVDGCYVWQKDGRPQTINAGRINWFGRDPNWKDIKDFRGQNDLDRPHGDWNKIELIAQNDKIDVYVNDVLVNQCFNAKPSAGQIQLQSEGAEIFFRRVTLLPLEN